MLRVNPRVDREHVALVNAMEHLAGRVRGIFELIDNHLGTRLAQLALQVVLIGDRACLKVEIDHSILVILVDEEHA